MYVANYHEERRMLAANIEGQAQDAAIFISGQSNYGKTWLLLWLKDEFAAKARFVRVDLGEPGDSALTTPVQVMNDCALKLGSDRFADYYEAYSQRPGNTAIIQNVQNTGNNNIFQATAAPPSIDDQKAEATRLTGPFVKGLAAAAAAGLPIVFCIDGFCAAKEVARYWIERALVGEIARTRCVRLVIAGQKAASDRLREEAGSLLPIDLGGVTDISEWDRVARELGSVLPYEAGPQRDALLLGCVESNFGEPARIMRWLQRQAPRAQA